MSTAVNSHVNAKLWGSDPSSAADKREFDEQIDRCVREEVRRQLGSILDRLEAIDVRRGLLDVDD